MMFRLDTVRGPTQLLTEMVVGFRHRPLTRHVPDCPALKGSVMPCREGCEVVAGTEVLVVGGNQDIVVPMPLEELSGRFDALTRDLSKDEPRSRLVVPVPVPRRM